MTVIVKLALPDAFASVKVLGAGVAAADAVKVKVRRLAFDCRFEIASSGSATWRVAPRNPLPPIWTCTDSPRRNEAGTTLTMLGAVPPFVFSGNWTIFTQ